MMIGTPNTMSCRRCEGSGVDHVLAGVSWHKLEGPVLPFPRERAYRRCPECKGFGFRVDSGNMMGFSKVFISVPDWQAAEIERLNRLHTEARHVLEDLVNDQRPNDSWVLRLVGKLPEVTRLAMALCRSDYSPCKVCGNWGGCGRHCHLSVLMGLTPVLRSIWVDLDHEVALAMEANRQRELQVFDIDVASRSTCRHDYLTNRVTTDMQGNIVIAGLACAQCFQAVESTPEWTSWTVTPVSSESDPDTGPGDRLDTGDTTEGE